MEKLKQLWLLTVLAVVAVFAIGYFALISPQQSKAEGIRGDVATTVASNRGLEAQIAMLKQQAKQLPKEQARLAELAKKMPNNPALPSLIRSLSDTADAANVDLFSINPSKPTVAAVAAGAPVTAAAPATGTVTATAPLPTLAILPVEVNVKGHFAQMREFLAGLEELQRSMLVGSIDLAPDCRPKDGDTPSADCDPLLMNMKIGARVFMTVTQSAPQPVTPAASAATEGK